MPVSPQLDRVWRLSIALPQEQLRGVALLMAIVLPTAAVLLLAESIGQHLPPLSREMTRHIALMNVAAPVLAMASIHTGRLSAASGTVVAAATIVQLASLIAFHTPVAIAAAHGSGPLHVIAQSILLLSALVFWIAVLSQTGAERWRGILALLVTGKVFCLLGAILTFAPRVLTGQILPAQVLTAHAGGTLDDQHLAGVLMLAACPATYVLAGVVIAVRWIGELPGAER